MEAVSIEKRVRKPFETKRVEQVKIMHTTQTGNAKQTGGKATEKKYERPNYLLRLL